MLGTNGLDLGDVSISRISSPGGSYRLCWCLTNCDRRDTFVDFGRMQILGPSPLQQHRTCISGQTCQLDLFFFGTFEVTEVLVLETCGSSSLVPGWASLTRSLSSSLNSTLEVFQSGPFSAAGGQYQMCWCTSCTTQDFHVGLGILTIVGPNPLSQVHTCTSGQLCQIHGITGYTSGQDSLLAVSTCGTPFTITAFQSGGSQSGSMAAWSAAITAAGGEYRLCWCSSFASCSAPDFIDMGELVLLGPSPLEQHRTCVSGLSCEFDGFLGKELSDLNKILLADTCGVASMPSSQIASLNTFGVSAVVSWGSLEISGGVYRLCWCSGQSDGSNIVACQAAEDFQTDAGSLTVIGVSPLGQEKTCISGFPCEIDGITGIYTSSGDQFLVLQTCGVSTTVPGFPGIARFDVAPSGGLVSWGSTITAAGGRYALCWCPDLSSLPGNASCRASCNISTFCAIKKTL